MDSRPKRERKKAVPHEAPDALRRRAASDNQRKRKRDRAAVEAAAREKEHEKQAKRQKKDTEVVLEKHRRAEEAAAAMPSNAIPPLEVAVTLEGAPPFEVPILQKWHARLPMNAEALLQNEEATTQQTATPALDSSSSSSLGRLFSPEIRGKRTHPVPVKHAMLHASPLHCEAVVDLLVSQLWEADGLVLASSCMLVAPAGIGG